MTAILRLLKLVNPYKWWMLLAALLGFLTIGSSIGLLMTSAYIIAKAALHPSIAELQIGIVGVRFFGITRGIFRYLERLVSHRTTFNLLAHFRVTFFRALERMAPAQIIYYKSADLFNRIFSDIQYLENFYVRAIAPPLVAVITSVIVWFLFGLFDPLFALVVLGFHFLAGLILPFFTYRMHKNIEEKILDLKDRISIKLIDGIQGLSELIIFGQRDTHFRELQHMDRKLSALQKISSNFHLLHEAVIGLLMNGAVLTILITGAQQVTTNALPALYLPVLILGVMASFEMIIPLPDAIRFLDSSERSGRRLFEILDAAKGTDELPAPASDFKIGDIRFEHVHLRYDVNASYVLNDISFNISRGSKVAFVGPSGAGKTSIAHLLLAFVENREGKITVGGKELKKVRREQINENMAYISQDSHLFNGTIADNLRLVCPTADAQTLLQTLQKARLEKFAGNSDSGLNVWVGEHGMHLSGGERQRLFAARAILKNSPVIILDEITSGLDSKTEKDLLHSLLDIFSDKTMIFITHKTALLADLDYIYVVNDGKIIEQGTPGHLLNLDGYLSSMYTFQSVINLQ